MHKVVHHDLPNQMVALHSLLQLLNDEESARLSAEGREYVRRLQNATKQSSEMVRFLKEIDRIHTISCKAETVKLSALARELQGEFVRLYPGTQFAFEWQWQVPALVGDVRVFLHATRELFAGLMQPPGKSCRVSASSAQRGEAVELAFRLEESPTPTRANPQKLEERMEIILAREWLALAGAELMLSVGAESRFVVVVPK